MKGESHGEGTAGCHTDEKYMDDKYLAERRALRLWPWSWIPSDPPAVKGGAQSPAKGWDAPKWIASGCTGLRLDLDPRVDGIEQALPVRFLRRDERRSEGL